MQDDIVKYWDKHYEQSGASVSCDGELEFPSGVNEPLKDRNVLIYACGTGGHVVQAASAGARVTALDISEMAVRNAKAVCSEWGVDARFVVVDGADTGLPTGSFDVVWGSAVLHHLDHQKTPAELSRILAPGGKAYFLSEPTFFNPLLKLAYQVAFGGGRVGRRKKFLFIRRRGDEFEKPIESSDLDHYRDFFDVVIRPRGFMFFEKLSHTIGRERNRPRIIHDFSRGLDRLMSRIPGIRDYGYECDFILTKKP
jgi:SAM-dependent methyltransferase